MCIANDICIFRPVEIDIFDKILDTTAHEGLPSLFMCSRFALNTFSRFFPVHACEAIVNKWVTQRK